MKEMLFYSGDPSCKVPKWVHLTCSSQLSRAASLQYPLIVKHFSGYGSIGMTRASKCLTEVQLREQVGVHRPVVMRWAGAGWPGAPDIITAPVYFTFLQGYLYWGGGRGGGRGGGGAR